MQLTTAPLPGGVLGTTEVQVDQEYLAYHELTAERFHELLSAAHGRVLSMGVGDAMSHIGGLVAQLFVAKMLFVQTKLGLPQEAMVIQPPDATIQITSHKFLRCVPEAAKIRWGDAASHKPTFIPAEVDIDFCGMIAVGLDSAMDAFSLAENILRMKEHIRDIEGQPVDTDCILPGNHFANIYEVINHERFALPRFVGITHLASDEYRERLRELVAEVAHPISTPFGPCLAVVGNGAQTYWEIAQEGKAFAARKRRTIAREIFRTDRLLADDGHYEMTGPTTCVIGCNDSRDADAYHVLVSKASAEAYLVQGTKGVPPHILRDRGIAPDSLLYHEAQSAAVLPHGSGHALIEDVELATLRFTSGGLIFVTTLRSGGQRAVQHYNAVPAQSRDSVLPETLAWGLARHTFATLRPLCSVKV